MTKVLSLILLSTIAVLLSCSDDQPTEPINSAPSIESISASPASIRINKTTSLSCVAIDVEGDNLTYTWSADIGTFPNGDSGPAVNWKALSVKGGVKANIKGNNYIFVTVSDIKETVTDSVAVWIGAPRCPGTPTVTYSGKTYNTAQIGDQCWLKENLNVGTMIQSSTGGFLQTDNNVIEKYCYYNDEAYCDKYGGLYEWTEAMQYATTEGTQGICPDGWHIPTNGEYETLETYVGDQATTLTNAGFSALLAGYRYSLTGRLDALDSYTGFWSSTEYGSRAYYPYLSSNRSTILFSNSNKDYGFSIRCLKD